MHARKIEFSSDVVRIIRDLCKVVFNISNAEQMENIFGITDEQMEIVIQRIVNALPERAFQTGNKKKLREIKDIVAREFIFFQLQERWKDPSYEIDLANFIRTFTRDMESRI